MSNLHELVHKVNAIEAMIAEAGGEISPQVEAELALIESNLSERADDYAFVMERLELASEHWKSKAKQLTALAKGCDLVRERIKTTIKVIMQSKGTDEILGRDMRFKLSNSKPKLVLNEVLLDEKYKMQVIERVPDKKRIMELLENGLEIAGAELEPVFALKTMPLKKGQIA